MKNVGRIILLLAVVAGGIWLWRFFFPSPEHVITRNIEKLAHAVSVQPGQGYLPRLANAQIAGSYFASNVEFSIDIPNHQQRGTLRREDIIQGLSAINISQGVVVKASDISVTVAADKVNAEADVTVEIHSSGERDVNVQETRFSLRKMDGKWLITGAKTIRTFS